MVEPCFFRLGHAFRGGGHSVYQSVHMCDQENKKKGLFFRNNRDSRESRLGGKKCPFSRKRVVFVSHSDIFIDSNSRESQLGGIKLPFSRKGVNGFHH